MPGSIVMISSDVHMEGSCMLYAVFCPALTTYLLISTHAQLVLPGINRLALDIAQLTTFYSNSIFLLKKAFPCELWLRIYKNARLTKGGNNQRSSHVLLDRVSSSGIYIYRSRLWATLPRLLKSLSDQSKSTGYSNRPITKPRLCFRFGRKYLEKYRTTSRQFLSNTYWTIFYLSWGFFLPWPWDFNSYYNILYKNELRAHFTRDQTETDHLEGLVKWRDRLEGYIPFSVHIYCCEYKELVNRPIQLSKGLFLKYVSK